MPNLSGCRVVVVGSDSIHPELQKRLTSEGAEVVLAEHPEELSWQKWMKPPACAIIDLELPVREKWLWALKFGWHCAYGEYSDDFHGLETGALGLFPPKDPAVSARAPLRGCLRLRADAELYQPYSLENVLDALEKVLRGRIENPGRRTLVWDYIPEMQTQREAEQLVKSVLVTCGMPENTLYKFYCGVREAIDNVRRHETQVVSESDTLDGRLEREVDGTQERARLWLETDEKQVSVAVSSKSWRGRGCLEDIFGRAMEEAPPETAKRRSREGRPGGLGYHIMREVSDELRYESERGAVCLVKHLGKREDSYDSRRGI